MLLVTLRVPIAGIHDELSYLLMGDTFAHGRLANPTHPMWISFETFHVNWQPTYSSMYPPAQGLVLAVGEWLGNPWIGVLLSNAAMSAAVLWMLQAWLPPRWALVGGVIVSVQLCFATYWMNGYWGGAVAAAGGALVTGALARILRHARTRDALWLGFGLAILANSRPFEGLVLCIPSFLCLAAWLFGKVKTRFATATRWKNMFLPLVACGVLLIAFMGYYNWRLTGNPLLLPHVLNTRANDTGKTFLWQEPGAPKQYHNAVFADFYNRWEREYYEPGWDDFKSVTLEKIDIFGTILFWKGEYFLLPFVPFLFCDRKMRLLLVTFFLSGTTLFLVVWGQSHYAAPLVCVIAALVVQSMRHANAFEWRGRRVGSIVVRLIVVLLFVQIGASALEGHCDPYEHHCEGIPRRDAIAKRISALPGKHLVLVHYEADHDPNFEWVYNGAEIDSAKLLWARELDKEQNSKLLNYFKDRQIWIVDADDDDAVVAPYVAPQLILERKEKP